jgi:hypothetical protein
VEPALLNTTTLPPAPGRTTTRDVAFCRAVNVTDVTPGRAAPYWYATSVPDAVGATALSATTTPVTPVAGTPPTPVTRNRAADPPATA